MRSNPKVYHGTKHVFDKFSNEFIGSGQGQMSYGYGMYFSDKKEIAESYAEFLGELKIDGKKIEFTDSKAYDEHGTLIPLNAAEADVLKDALRAASVDHNVQRALRIIRTHEQERLPYTRGDHHNKILTTIQACESLLDRMSSGRLYSALVPDSDNYLHFNKPLKEQVVLPKIMSLIETLYTSDVFMDNMKGVYAWDGAWAAAGQMLYATKNEALAYLLTFYYGEEFHKHLVEFFRQTFYTINDWSTWAKLRAATREVSLVLRSHGVIGNIVENTDKNVGGYVYVVFDDKDIAMAEVIR